MRLAQKRALVARWREEYGFPERLLAAFMAVPRERFIDASLSDEAYGDYPLPIGGGQTISQPTTVMLMTHFLAPEPDSRVLEVGAGSGYQAAVLSRLVPEGKVISVEYDAGLAETARRNLRAADAENVEVVVGDGGDGLPDRAPFDRIIVTCACPKVPGPLVAQLAEGGALVAPVSGLLGETMVRLTKEGGKVKKERLGLFSFVPLRGRHGSDG
ncbi:protein-L-isoaspartate(D-aspartate) O-methyltransferase [Candidatus Woesearchaeota archaeon]|nr:protein-L-isoaspartate(D-aspartate) O-methyltransferase [Candidatus Woesearchaeota archaeon]